MFDLTGSPDFMAALRAALLVAMGDLAPGLATPPVDPENAWLTPRETYAFLKMSESAFARLRHRLKENKESDRIVVSHALGNTEPRYQLASLQRFMREAAPALPKPEPAIYRDRQ